MDTSIPASNTNNTKPISPTNDGKPQRANTLPINHKHECVL